MRHASTRWGFGPSRAATPRRVAAFTLLEVVLAIGILLALVSLTLPLMTGLSANVRFKEASRTIENATAMARADAISSAGPVALVARERSNGQVELRGVKLDSLPKRSADEVASRITEQSEVPPTSSRGEVYAHLPDGVKVQLPENGGDIGTDSDDIWGAGVTTGEQSSLLAGISTQISNAVAREVVLAVMLPNGGARSDSTYVLRDRVGREATIHVNSWTGVATVDAPIDPRSARSAAGTADADAVRNTRSPGAAPKAMRDPPTIADTPPGG